ncbi:MAG TPA: phosphoribosylamine--glycine ligase, partial [Gemmataceae bacterium]|nr:phosphoribosylamine--glycine ligase [Gemmataceae bacterium]
GRQIVVEKKLEGEELSILALVAGRTIIPLAPAQDHKRAFDGDTGPNTGGMGAYCPAPLGTPKLLDEIETEALVPTVHAMKRARVPFRGILYAGVICTNQGPRILEYNCRLGDPETQPVLMRLKTDLCSLLEAVVDDRLAEFADGLEWDPRPSVCVVMASGGYPGNYPKGKMIQGLAEAAKVPDVKVFHAGTKLEPGGMVLTDGGRVLGITALGTTLAEAKARAYEAVGKISFPGAMWRKDIADKAIGKGM